MARPRAGVKQSCQRHRAGAPGRAAATPTGALSRRPHGRFFSAAMTSPSASIQPTLPVPTTNMISISAQQQPTQNAPCASPSPQASRAGLRPRQCAMTTPSGLRQRSRHRRFSPENWNSPGHRQHRRPERPAVEGQPRRLPHPGRQHQVRQMRRDPEPRPGREIPGGRQQHQPPRRPVIRSTR